MSVGWIIGILMGAVATPPYASVSIDVIRDTKYSLHYCQAVARCGEISTEATATLICPEAMTCPVVCGRVECAEEYPCPEPPEVLAGPIVEEPSFQQCMHGPGVSVAEVCQVFDVPPVPETEGDGDVDLQDWAGWYGNSP
jgi:hypothetical protein